MTDLHAAVRDVYDGDPPLGTAEADIHMIARSGRLVDASMKRCARLLDAEPNPFSDPAEIVDLAESYLLDALRRFRRLRRLLAVRKAEGFVDVRVHQVWQPRDPRRAGRRLVVVEVHPETVVALSSPAEPCTRGAVVTCRIPRQEMALDYQLVQEAPNGRQ